MFFAKRYSKKNGVSLSRLAMRRHSIIVFSIIVLLLVSVFCYLILRTTTSNIKSFYRSSTEYAVKSGAEYLENRLTGYEADLERISHMPVLNLPNTRAINGALAGVEAMEQPPYVFGLYFADMNGDFYTKDGRRLNFKKEEFFDAFYSGRTKAEISRDTQDNYMKKAAFTVAKTIYGESGMRGVLFYVVDLKAIKDPVSALPFARNSSCFVMNDLNEFLIEPEFESVIKTKAGEEEQLSQKEKSALYDFKDAIKYQDAGSVILESYIMGTEYISFAKVKNSKWTIGLVETEHPSYINSLNSSGSLIALFVIFAILVIFAFAFVTLSGSRGKSSHRLTLQQDSDFDELTGLWTESRFEEECERILDRNPDKNYMLFGIDIRGFRIVQQTEGVAAANEQIMMLAKRLGQIAMLQNGIAARGAIDHLYLMYPLKEKQGKKEALKEFNNFLYNGNYFPGRSGERISTKTGIVFAGKDFEKDTVQNLIAKTSYAKHIIQDNLLQNYSVYDASMEARIIKDKKIERYIPIAFAHKEFYVVYQPKVDLTNGKVIGAEALVRWDSPELGLCMPDEFITLFERNGYINRLDFYVYQQVFEFLDERIKAGKPSVPISVNMSRFHLGDEGFVKKFYDLFEQYNIPPSLIEVEIIERSVGVGDNRLLEVTRQLHEKKFRVAIDDFGSGESSLNIISEIPADVLKLDQKFMRVDKNGKLPSEDEYKIVAKIVEMAKSLGKETICEGVETEQQIAFLRSVDVNYVQGYYYSRPLSEEDFITYLERHV